jgi:hypothetical protein
LSSLFISYSHKHEDEDLKERLCAHLAPLIDQGLIDDWHDRKMKPGDDFNKEISDKLEKADVILLLVSSDFLASPYIMKKEVPAAMRLHKKNQARVIPVILRHSDWREAPFGGLLATPKDGKPIKSWPDADEAFLDVVRMIRTTLQQKELSKDPPASGESLPLPAENKAITSANIALFHTSFLRADITTAKNDGLTYYQIEVIVIAASAVRKHIERVEYILAAAWPKELREQIITDHSTRFKMKELAFGSSIVEARVWIKGAEKPIRLNRFIDLRPDGPRI